ncbi:MAG: S41 family peptidase [Thermodesulfobacteriota bacterium]|nr:S41 family peptidase [Thermodesulfobacteriota bacterium]
MKKYFSKKLILLTFLAILSVLLFLPWYFGGNQASAIDEDTYKNLKMFNEVLDMVEKNYVEEVEPKTIIQGAIKGMIKSLDPHSTFMTADMYRELQVETKGSFGGIGIVITIQKDFLTVVSPIEDTPAFLAGVKAGDRITKINGKSTEGITIMEAVKKLRGPKNTNVTITVMHKGSTQPEDIVITRAIIKIKSVKYKIYADIGYIRILAFQGKTADDLKNTIQDINKKKVPLKGLILDLRNNPGGLLDQAVKVSDIFIKSGVIVSTKGRIKSVGEKYIAKDDGNEPVIPMIVLVNGGTASAAEIVSGALQDNGRAIILGTQTFGKGSVQTVIPLKNGAALKLTTAKYYTPKGKSIQAEGIIPDIVVEHIKPSDEKEPIGISIREKDLKGHIKGINEKSKEVEDILTKKVPDDLKKDNQLKSAIDLLKSWEMFRDINKG